MTCRCRACASLMARGERPNPGVSVLADMHVTAAEMPPPMSEQRREERQQEAWLRAPEPRSSPPPPVIKRKTVRRISDAALAEVIGEALGEVEARCMARITALETQITELRFVPWAEGKTFRAGNITSMGGAVYACVANTETRPAPDSSSWVLLMTKPRDGRDYTPPPPPSPGGPRTVRSSR
jgi:hypothetical protein